MSESGLEIQKREIVGKKANQQLKKEGKIPGIYLLVDAEIRSFE